MKSRNSQDNTYQQFEQYPTTQHTLNHLGNFLPQRNVIRQCLLFGDFVFFSRGFFPGVLYDESLYEGVVQIATAAPNATVAP